MTRTRRLAAGALALVAVAAAALAERVERPARPEALLAAAATTDPTAAVEGATSSAWLCPGGTNGQLGQGDVTVALANPTGEPMAARVDALPTAGSTGQPGSRTVDLPARGSATVRLADLVGGPTPAGARVVGPGGLVAQQLVKTPEGQAAGPCASAGSDRWFTAVGSTAAGSSLHLSLLNPFPDDAIADLAFSTDDGRKVPAELQGVVVPASSLVVLDVGEHVRRRDAVAAEVVLRRGRLAVGRTFRKGTTTSTALAAPSASPTWHVAGGQRVEGASSRLVVANPSDQDATVAVEVRLAEGATTPLNLEVPAQSRAELPLDVEQVPRGVAYSVVAKAADDVPIVVERSTEGRGGRSDVVGTRTGATGWVAAVGGGRSDVLAVLNPGEGEATVRVLALDGSSSRAPLGGDVKVPPGGRASIRLDDDLGGRPVPVLVESDADVVVERDAGEGGVGGGSVGVRLGGPRIV